VSFTILLILLLGIAAEAGRQEPQPASPAGRQLRVFLDCGSCFSDYLRSEITFIDFVRERSEAEIHLLITQTSTGSGGTEYTAEFIGSGRFDGVQRTAKAITTSSDSEDTIRRQLANAVRIGLLSFIAQDGVPQQLDLEVDLGTEQARPAVAGDRWNNWVFSVRGEGSFDGEESRREMQLGGSMSADRITPDWKITLGTEIDFERERFNLDEEDEEPLEVERREREFRWLAVKALGEHWSAGARGDVESSTFENISLAASAEPAIEYNVFPYSEYTRRQLRILYAIGPRTLNYYEETLFGKTEETLVQHELSATYDQREQWGSLEARVEWSQYLHDLELSRLEADGEVSLRIARGLSVSAELNASRIRDQVSLPARGATPEEILLRLRELSSGYEYSFSFGLTYTFGSIFSSVVNPRFGQ
jgi:hypothetical protein